MSRRVNPNRRLWKFVTILLDFGRFCFIFGLRLGGSPTRGGVRPADGIFDDVNVLLLYRIDGVRLNLYSLRKLPARTFRPGKRFNLTPPNDNNVYTLQGARHFSQVFS